MQWLIAVQSTNNELLSVLSHRWCIQILKYTMSVIDAKQG